MNTLRRGRTREGGGSSGPSGATRQLQGSLDALQKLPKAMKVVAEAAKEYRAQQTHLAAAGQKMSVALRGLGDSVFDCGCTERGDMLRQAAEQLHGNEEQRYVCATRLWDSFIAPALGQAPGGAVIDPAESGGGSVEAITREVAGVREKLSKAAQTLDQRANTLAKEWAKAQKVHAKKMKKIDKRKGDEAATTSQRSAQEKKLAADETVYTEGMSEVNERRIKLDEFFRAYRDLHTHNGVIAPLSEAWQFFKEFSDVEQESFTSPAAQDFLAASSELIQIDLPALPFVQISSVALEKRLVRPDNLRRQISPSTKTRPPTVVQDEPENGGATDSDPSLEPDDIRGSFADENLPPKLKSPGTPTRAKQERVPKAKREPKFETRTEVRTRREPQVVEQTHSFVFALIDYETQGFLVDNEVDSDIFVDATAEEFAGVFGDEETPATFLDIPFEEGNAMRILRDRGDSWYVVQLADSGLVGIVSSAAVSSLTETQVEVTIWTDVEETVDVQVEVEVSSGSSSDSSEYLSDDDAVDSVAVGKVTQEGHPEVASGGESVDEGDEPLSVLEKMMDRMRTPNPKLLSHETASYGTLHRMRSASVSKSSTTDTQPMRLVIKEGFIVKKGAKRRNWNKRYCKLTVSQFQKLGALHTFDETLTYYKDVTKKEKGCLHVNDILRLEEPPLKGHSITRKNAFALVTTQRSYYFAFDSPTDMKGWVDAINSVLHEAMPDLHMSLPRAETVPSGSSAGDVPDHEIPFDELEFDSEIGRGGFGVVYRGKWNGGVVAIKQLRVDAARASASEELSELREEALLMMKLRRHPNCVLFLGYCSLPEFCLVVEFCSGGSLLGKIKTQRADHGDEPFPNIFTASIARGVAAGLKHLHDEGCVHRDIAARNVLLTSEDVPKLTDFGLAWMIECAEPEGDREFGPVKWMAPEALRRSEYSPQSDVYSYGILLWELVERDEPYGKDRDLIKIGNAVIKEELRPTLRDESVFGLLIRNCWAGDPEERPSLSAVLETLDEVIAEAEPAHRDSQ